MDTHTKCGGNIMAISNSKNTEKIVNAALTLFKEKGYANVSVSDISREAGIPRSSFYSLFAGKDDVIIYMLQGLKNDYQQMLTKLASAPNDLERIWMIYDRYLMLTMEFGTDLSSTLMELELREKIGIFDFTEILTPWLITLVRNCQNAGMIRNQNSPENIVALGMRIAIGAAYEWCRTDGGFNLRDKALSEHEILYDVPPEYRMFNK